MILQLLAQQQLDDGEATIPQPVCTINPMLPHEPYMSLNRQRLHQAPKTFSSILAAPTTETHMDVLQLPHLSQSNVGETPRRDCVGESHGRSFVIVNRKRLVEILPLYSNQSHWSSFRRQLNLYGFCRHGDVICHELFMRGHKYLCRYMMRVGASKASDKNKRLSNGVPDFANMTVIP